MASMTACIAETHAIREGQVAVLKKEMGVRSQAVLPDVTPC